MPPRRSTRSASVQPHAVEKSTANKRKRGQPAEEEAVTQQENVKPSTRNHKSSVGATTTRTRAFARNVKPMEGVQESEEEEDSPPVKKARPSIGSDNSDEEVDVKPPKPRKASTHKASSSTVSASRKRTAVKVEVVLDALPRSQRSSRAPSSQAPTRSARRGVNITKNVSDIEEDQGEGGRGGEELEEAEQRLSGRRKAASRVVEQDSDEEELLPSRSARRSASVKSSAVPSSKLRASSSRPNTKGRKVQPISEDEDDLDTPSQVDPSADIQVQTGQDGDEPTNARKPDVASVSNARHADPTTQGEEEEEEEEEEHSLLDIVQPPPSRAQVQTTIPEEPEGPKSRLVIHKMALVNFKSYAGRQEIGPFHKSFSSIVGPNGSGKSNTIDALLFVFGYRASKMRQGKLSELIHHSARYPDLGECSVEVHFREIIDLPGPDEFEIVPNSQLIVNRTAFKNNTNRYTINGRQSNYKEVQSLLKSRGIDLDHNRFLILQGEVESIAQMKAKANTEHEDGLLEYLEDIIGTSQYKEPIEEALAEVERLNEERIEKRNRLKIVERECEALKEDKKEAEDYLRMQNNHTRLLSQLWQLYMLECFRDEDEYKKTISITERELKEETERNQSDITHLEMLEEHYKERGEIYEEVKVAAAEALKDLAAHEKKQVSLEERRKHTNTKVKKLTKSLQEDEHAKAEATRAIKDNAEKMDREKTKADELEASLTREEKILEVIRDSLKDKTQVYHDQIEVKQKELQPWTAKINAKQAEIDVATSERDTLAKKAAGIKEAGKEAQTTLEKLREDHQSKVSEFDQLNSERATKQQEFKVGQRRLQEMQARLQDLRSKASSSRQKVEEAKASQAANTSQSRVLEGLTRLKNAGRISGFYGRLGSLGTIPDKYDVAVSTACGALNNMVVDNVDQAQACIDHLRKQNLGRASFLVLSKLRSDGMQKIPTPENVPRLFDLIKCKDLRFAPAFFKGLNNTLVAENLDQANRIAFGGQRRWRVVTLAGQLIDASGTMSGGGNHVARGGMSSKFAEEAVSPEVLRKYEQDSEQAAQELEEALRVSKEIEAEMDALSRAGPQVDVAIEKVNLDIQNGAKRIADAEKRVRELKAQSKPDAGDLARIASLEEDIAASTEELNGLQERTASIEEEIKKLEKKILEIGGARLLSQKSKVDGIRLHINLANDEITKAEVAKAKAEKDTSKLRHTIETSSANLEEVQGELEDLNEQLEECIQYVNAIRSKVEAAQTAAENSKDDLESLKAELDEKSEQIQDFRKKEMALRQTLETKRKEAEENNQRLDHWQHMHDGLKLVAIGDEDEDDDDEIPEQADQHEDGPVKAEPVEANLSKLRAKDTRTLKVYRPQDIKTFVKEKLLGDAEYLDEQLKNANPNLNVLEDYKKRHEEFKHRTDELDKVTELRDAQKQKYERLRKQRLDEFMAGFSTISLKLKEMYQMITLGGNAELELVDTMDPFAEGVTFSVMPPKKSWRNIANLSGGEKTLSSLALVFALHVYKPTPLYFMDEIDAALDFRNVSIVANYIKDRTKNAQFIIISLRNDMFELSHRLIGIYKTANATQSIAIDNHILHSVPLSTARG